MLASPLLPLFLAIAAGLLAAAAAILSRVCLGIGCSAWSAGRAGQAVAAVLVCLAGLCLGGFLLFLAADFLRNAGLID